MKNLFVLSLFMLLFSLASRAQQTDIPYVLLVSFDAFRYDYVEKFNLPHFKSFIKKGSQAEGLLPSFPSKTFPNHYTIVTGLYPGHHGLVDNSFYDPARKETFSRRDKKIALDPYYYGGTPIWLLAQQKGMKVAPYFWVGSEVLYNDRYPDYNDPYSDTTSNQERVNRVLGWLELPEKDRPHFITLYFSSVDNAGHNFGVSSAELKKAVEDVDAVLGNLVDRVGGTQLPVNIIIVSDHGMKELSYQPDTYVHLNEILNLEDPAVRIINNGTHSHIYIDRKSKIDSVYAILKKAENNFNVYKAEQFPERWHYNNPRSGDIFITAAPGKELTLDKRGSTAKKPGSKWGEHGYDPDTVGEMKGIFYASGPNIKPGMKVQAFRNIHIYPFIAKILGLETPPIDGSIKILQDLYKP